MATLDNGFVDSGSSPPSGEQLKRRTHEISATQTASVVAPQVDFRTVAAEHIARGFVVSATKPGSKEGIPGWNTYNVLHTIEDVDRFLAKHPECANSNVAVCGSCGLHYAKRDGEQVLEGNIFVIDVDADGVVEQILAENPGKELPKTYIVQSRPKSKPYKVHIYFRHTKHSVQTFTALARRFDKTTKEHSGIRDLTKPVDERGLHPNRYDVKGSGKAGYVLGAGSVHSEEDGGETYTAMNDNPVLDAPDWIIDWLIKDLSTYYASVAAQRRLDAEHAKVVAALSPKKQAALRRENNAEGFVISKEGTYSFLRAKARFFAKNGMPKNFIREYLVARAPVACHGGREFIESEAGKRAVDRIIESLEIDDRESWLQHADLEPQVEPGFIAPLILDVVTSRHSTLLSIGGTFPKVISSAEIYRRFYLKADDSKDRMAAGRAMKTLGYKVDKVRKVGALRYWRLV